MSDTPQTDAADSACGVSGDFARQLERERNSTLDDCLVLTGRLKGSREIVLKLERERDAAIQSAKDNSKNYTSEAVKRIEAERERDKAIKEKDSWYNNFIKVANHAMERRKERDQIRKVCDELAAVLSSMGQVSETIASALEKEKALAAYNNLPHVKNKN
jgi:hypothetical protein